MSRKVVTRSPHREVGIVNAGWLLGQPVEYESHLERRFILSALSCSVVCNIQHQPFTCQLPAPVEGKYTPDFLVTFRDGSTLVVEVKPKVYVKQHEQRLDAAAKLLSEQGHAFFVATDEHIDGNALSARALLLMRFGRVHLSDEQALEALKKISDFCEEHVSVRTLVERSVREETVWALVARHKCRVSNDFRIDPEQVVTTTPFQGDCHDYFLSWFGASLR